MNNIFIFEPSNRNNPHDNVIKFIEFCKDTISNNNLTTSRKAINGKVYIGLLSLTQKTA